MKIAPGRKRKRKEREGKDRGEEVEDRRGEIKVEVKV